MQPVLSNDRKKKTWLSSIIIFILLILLAFRLGMKGTGLDARGAETWLKIFFLLILYGYIYLVSYGLGRFVLKRFQLPLLTNLESILLGYLFGFTFLSVGIMLLGLVGWLSARNIYLWLAVSGIIALIELNETGIYQWKPVTPESKSLYAVLLRVIASIGILVLFLECLLPVWDYDALLYHLEVPRQYFAQGRIYFDPEILRSAYPYLGEMLFLPGIAFGLDSLAKLVNFSYGILFVLSVYFFSHRFFGNESALITAGILIGAPAFWMWSTWASIDFAWASYEFWSVYAISLWLLNEKKTSSKWLILAGTMSGLAISTKYLSIPSVMIVGVLIVWKSWENSARPVKDIVSNLLIFGVTVGVVAAPWYLKNWLWAGNPVYPLVFGGLGWDPLENQVLNDYVYSFGVGKRLSDFLLLPYNVYAFQDRFSTIGLERIHPVLWLAILFPIILKPVRKYELVIVYTFLGFAVWATNSQVIRFLIPLTGFFAILAGAVIQRFSTFLKNLLCLGLIGGFMLFNLIFQASWFWEHDSWSYLIGKASAKEYLQNMNYDFQAIQFAQETLAQTQRVLFLWDGRNYYCDKRCIPDDEQSTAVMLAFASPSPEDLAGSLRRQGITHLLWSKPDAIWFMSYHDPNGLHKRTFDYFTKQFFPTCGKAIYADDAMSLFEITCQ